MAPTNDNTQTTETAQVMEIGRTDVDIFQPTSFFTGTEIYQEVYIEPAIIEEEQERLDRISEEKMRESWKRYHQRAPLIIRMKQVCKPMHRISPGVFSGM